MECQFYLLDVDEREWGGKPCARFWGIDESGKRILILCNLIMPYFYYLPDEEDNIEELKKEIERNTKVFSKVLNVTQETKRLLGHERKVLKITCSDSDVRTNYASQLRKIFGKGRSFEHDLRISVRYLIDFMLAPCGWNECDVKEINLENVAAEATYLATEAPRSVSEDKTPSLRILALNALTASERGSAKPERDPVRALCLLTNSGKSATLLPNVEDDSNVLKGLVEFVNSSDPDLIVSFGANKLDWPYLIQRARVNGLDLRVGRDGGEPHSSVYGHISVAGRANLDLSDVADSITEVKVKTLENIARFLQLPSATKVTTIDEYDRFRLWNQESGRTKLLENARMMAEVSLELAESTINFPMQLSRLTGLPLDHVVTAAVGFRVDSYMVNEAHRIGELIPARNDQPFFTYRGALVLEPSTGLHDNVAVLDFASMYPVLMKKYNLSPDTLVQPNENLPEDSVNVIPEVNHKFRKEPPGFYRVVLTRLINERLSLKETLKKLSSGSTEYKVLKDRERALKVVTNACYGYAGWAGARWYAREVAESAAALGRQTITKTIERARAMGLTIIYGDTDSIFVTNDAAKVDELCDWVRREFRDSDSDTDVEIRVERVYNRVLFTEAMKRYAGLLPNRELDIVGLEVIRGDWSDIARQVQEEVLREILLNQSTEKAVEAVRTTIRKLRNGEVPIADLTIRKTLTKPIEKYAVRAPHVEVARKLVEDGWRLTVGDKVAYVIAKGRGNLFKKARPFNQVKPEDIDTEYYVENQVKPAAMRILELFGIQEKQVMG